MNQQQVLEYYSMSRALCIPFHRYQPHTTDHYRIYFEYFLKSLEVWGNEFDALYLIDSDHGFSDEDLEELDKYCKNISIIKGVGSHWDNLRKASKEIVEDYVLFMDMDVLIWKKGVIYSWFKEAEKYDVYTAFDNSGGLVKEIHKQYPFMKENNFSRMGTYYFIMNRKALSLMSNTRLEPVRFQEKSYIKELWYYYAKAGDWLDSLGFFTLKLLYNNFDLGILFDPRESIYLEDGKRLSDTPLMDAKGYYHLRNGGLITRLLASNNDEHRNDFEHFIDITPNREILRLLAWHQFMGLDEQDVISLLAKLDVAKGEWDKYYNEFKIYHGL